MKIYVASSWRNAIQPAVVIALREAGHDVYDFRNPRPGDTGFRWSDIDPAWKAWSPPLFIEALKHPIAINGFSSDKMAMLRADVCVLVMPCGRSAHLEAGYFTGAGKPLHILLSDGEPELMYRMADELHCTIASVVEALGKVDAGNNPSDFQSEVG